MTDATPTDGGGLGWAVDRSNCERYIEPMGVGLGFATTLCICPEAELEIAILTNGTDLDRTDLAHLLGKVDW